MTFVIIFAAGFGVFVLCGLGALCLTYIDRKQRHQGGLPR